MNLKLRALPAKEKIYFASDFHLGIPNYESSLAREKKVVAWLDSIKHDAAEIYLVGDLFDFWFEYKHTVPKGFVRLLGKIAEIADSGTPIHLFIGNHDMWMFDYLPHELGVSLHKKPIERTFNGKTFYIGHGDGLGPGDRWYKFLKKIHQNKICQWLWARLHPNFGMALGNFFSRRSRIATGTSDSVYLGDDKEWLVIFCKEKLKEKHFDYFVFGHRHLPINVKVGENSTYINLGEWVNYYTYAEFDGKELLLKKFE
ncbi:MAG TPA: UDP-2,3-diacylglucosamine diphosphatase [Bacteroidia bacterium]|nr:UDP-2,3-diacylglucosamine diphosphatase [Bacteroidia bacterium]